MNLLPTAPLTIGQVLDNGFRLYRQAFPRLIGLMLCIALAGVIPIPFQIAALGSAATAAGAISAISSIVGAIVALILYAAVVLIAHDSATGKSDVTLGGALTSAVRLSPRLVAASVAVVVVTIVGFILLVVPGIMLGVSMTLYMVILLVEGAGALASIKASRQLTEGHWWRMATILTVGVLIYMAIVAGLVAVLGLLVPVTGVVSHFASLKDTAGGPPAAVVVGYGVFLLVAGILRGAITPLLVSILLTAYYDLTLRKRGLDLAGRIAASA